MQLFGSLKLLMALLGSSCPLFGRSGPKMGPKMVPKNAQKRNQNCPTFFKLFFQNALTSLFKIILSQFWDPKRTRVFAQNSKKIYKRNQDEPKRAIMSFKESFQTPQKTSSFYTFLGPEASQESLKKPKSRPRSTQRAPKAHAKNCQKKSQKMPPW